LFLLLKKLWMLILTWFLMIDRVYHIKLGLYFSVILQSMRHKWSTTCNNLWHSHFLIILWYIYTNKLFERAQWWLWATNKNKWSKSNIFRSVFGYVLWDENKGHWYVVCNSKKRWLERCLFHVSMVSSVCI